MIKVETVLEVFLEDLGLYSSTAKVSGFLECQLRNSRNSTLIFRR